jgi:thiosulfate dehydrogenase [quinone] large subunit
MSSSVYGAATARSAAPAVPRVDIGWRNAAIALLSVRFIQGWIYWGGGTRRFIYAPSKLDPTATTWMAHKFQSAMPGAVLGTGEVISFLLHHFWLLYPAVILFSAAELIAGLFLMAGLFTRASAVVSVGFSVVLMLMFGWQGATCIDEWTMAAANAAMGATLFLAGGGAYALDNVLLRRNPALAQRGWFRWLGGSQPLPLGDVGYKWLALGVLACVVAFDVGTYHYYRGSVVSAFHGGPVSPTRHHIALDGGVLAADGAVTAHVYIDGGTPEAPAYIVAASLSDAGGRVVESWDAAALGALAPGAIRNDYAYRQIKTGHFGLIAPTAAMATIVLPPAAAGLALPAGLYHLALTTAGNRSFRLLVASARGS